MVGFSLAGKVSFLTGVGRGFGLDLAQAIAQAGALVYVSGRGLRESTLGGAEGSLSPWMILLPAEVTETPSRPVEYVMQTVGTLNLHVSLVHLSEDGLPSEPLSAVWQRQRTAAAYLQAQGGGRLLTIVLCAGSRVLPVSRSLVGQRPPPRQLSPRALPARPALLSGRQSPSAPVSMAESAPSAAALHLSIRAELNEGLHHLHHDFSGSGVAVNVITCGLTAPSATASGGPSPLAALAWDKPEQVLQAALFLCSDEAAYISGHILSL